MRRLKSRSFQAGGFLLRIGLLCAFLVAPVVVGCNSHPLQSLNNITYAPIEEKPSSSANKGVDILFVIDNSGSMAEEQTKLRNNFKSFIQRLLRADIRDFQIGVITTDVDELFNPDGRGQLVQAESNAPKIISSQLTETQVIEQFSKTANVGTLGSNFEQPLKAVELALSPSSAGGFADTQNKGFLRDGALLAIIFVTDEDDCSYKGKELNEDQVPESCYIPSSVTLMDDQGNPLIGADGKPQKGQMDKLLPTSHFLDFLKSLNREVIVSGLIGNPFINKPNSQSLIDPQGGCTQASECGGGGKCAYLTPDPITRKCGGCTSVDANAAPSFRVFDFISRSSAGEPNERWFPICGDNEGFQKALLDFASAIAVRLKDIVLSKKPVDPSTLLVRIEKTDGSFELIPKASIVGDCNSGAICQGLQECNPTNNKCYGDGWFYVAPLNGSTQHLVKLSGSAKARAEMGTLSIHYLGKIE
ncbi:MAG: VWA domain-containing protein [Myxococcales bacterium]|nr:VWA domain-containing protein [Myxococcales bacterium]MCB9642884.1 VWA domain-containing protein [Myxococcales bacterium]